MLRATRCSCSHLCYYSNLVDVWIESAAERSGGCLGAGCLAAEEDVFVAAEAGEEALGGEEVVGLEAHDGAWQGDLEVA